MTVDAVAAAIAAADANQMHPFTSGPGSQTGDGAMTPYDRERYRAMARAAMAALTPTPTPTKSSATADRKAALDFGHDHD